MDSRVNPWSEDSRRRAPGSLPGNREKRLVRPWAGDNQREVLRLVHLDRRYFPDRDVTAAQRMTLDSLIAVPHRADNIDALIQYQLDRNILGLHAVFLSQVRDSQRVADSVA
jgi:hypothetical protein